MGRNLSREARTTNLRSSTAQLARGNIGAELVGCDALRDFAGKLYGELDPASVLHHDEPLRVENVTDGYLLHIALPFAERDELELGRNGSELLVRVGPHRRSMLLPDALAHRPVVDATLGDGELAVRFGLTGSGGAAGD